MTDIMQARQAAAQTMRQFQGEELIPPELAVIEAVKKPRRPRKAALEREAQAWQAGYEAGIEAMSGDGWMYVIGAICCALGGAGIALALAGVSHLLSR